VLDSVAEPERDALAVAKEISYRYGIINKWLEAGKKSKYQIERLLNGLKKKKTSKKR
jgi:hypothetical protein